MIQTYEQYFQELKEKNDTQTDSGISIIQMDPENEFKEFWVVDVFAQSFYGRIILRDSISRKLKEIPKEQVSKLADDQKNNKISECQPHEHWWYPHDIVSITLEFTCIKCGAGVDILMTLSEDNPVYVKYYSKRNFDDLAINKLAKAKKMKTESNNS